MLLLGYYAAQVSGAPAGATSFDLLQSEVLTGSQASVTFSDLGDYAADYQHLQIRMVALHSANQNSVMRYNGDSGSNYNWHHIRDSGSSVASFGAADDKMQVGTGINSTTIPMAGVIDILDPFDSNKFTTSRTLTGSATNNIRFISGLWRNTNPLSSIQLQEIFGSYRSGSRFSLYGLRKAA